MRHSSFVFRQIIRSKQQSLVFVLCVILSMVSLVALNGFSESINRSLLKDAKTLHAADIIIQSTYPLTRPVLNAVADLKKEGRVKSARVYEFYSMVGGVDGGATLLADVKVVEKGYPFYGKVELTSERSLENVLIPGGIIVEQAVLDRLDLQPGDFIRIGNIRLKILDIVVREPDRPVKFFSIGPRIFVSAEDLDKLGLVQKGSRIKFIQLIRVNDENEIDSIAEKLRRISSGRAERIETFRTAESGVRRFFDNFLFFLNLIGSFTLLLAGIGIQSTLSALLRKQVDTIAVMKALGAGSRLITFRYVLLVLVLGIVGTAGGLILGIWLQQGLPLLFKGLLPQLSAVSGNGYAVGTGPGLSWFALSEGLLLGLFAVSLFTFLPLYGLQAIKPVVILKKEPPRFRKGTVYYLTVSGIAVVFVAMILWQLQDIRNGIYFVLGILVLVMAAVLSTHCVLFLLSRLRTRSLRLRLALKGLFRPQNATRAIIITFSASMAFIYAIYLIEQNLDRAFIQSYPEDAPNVFFLDIQPFQKDEFADFLGAELTFYPVIRSQITAINNVPIDRKAEKKRKGDNFARDFNLTYREELLEDERIPGGGPLFRRDRQGIQVSVLDSASRIQKIRLGDRIRFRIQGIPLEATVSSIRTRTRESVKPFFYFVFQEETLKDAPQTIFSALRIDKQEIATLQNRIVKKFPNITVIDVTSTLTTFADVMQKLSVVIRFFTVFGCIAGILIMISAVFATRSARILEAVYYKVLGATRWFVLSVFTLENFIIGVISAIIAFGIAQVGSYGVTRRVFDIYYHPMLLSGITMVAGTTLMVILIGLLASVSILRHKPAAYLRNGD